MDRNDVALLLAFGVALLGGGIAQRSLREQLGDYRKFAGRVADLPPLVGHVERALYTGALLAGEPLFVGLWLTLKVVGAAEVLARLSPRSEPPRAGHDESPLPSEGARTTYQRFLLLSALSLLWAAGGWAVAEAVKDCQDWRAGAIVAGLALGTGYLWLVSPKIRARWPAWVPRRGEDRR